MLGSQRGARCNGARQAKQHRQRWAGGPLPARRSSLAHVITRVATAEDGVGQEVDAFAALVRLAVEKDPSLAKLAEQHLAKKSVAASSAAGPAPQLLPAQTKPPWLRQRAPQGDK
jgi:lipoic acid synthetase